MENRPADAAHTYTDAIRFGNEISRGGLLIHRLVGIACQASGGGPLSKLAPLLSCEQARPLVAELEKIDEARAPWDEVLQSERIFVREQLRASSVSPLSYVTAWWMTRPAKKKAEDKNNKSVAHLRLLITELALRCFRSEQGHAAQRLEQLAPKHLQRVPIDPFSGQPLVYRVQGTNWLLYSMG